MVRSFISCLFDATDYIHGQLHYMFTWLPLGYSFMLPWKNGVSCLFGYTTCTQATLHDYPTIHRPLHTQKVKFLFLFSYRNYPQPMLTRQNLTTTHLNAQKGEFLVRYRLQRLHATYAIVYLFGITGRCALSTVSSSVCTDVCTPITVMSQIDPSHASPAAPNKTEPFPASSGNMLPWTRWTEQSGFLVKLSWIEWTRHPV